MIGVLFDPSRHEPLNAQPWNALRARETIDWIVRETNAAFTPRRYWPSHPKDLDPGDDAAALSTTLYYGAAGVVWALRYLQESGACGATVADEVDLTQLRDDNRAWLRAAGFEDFGSYLMGDLPIELMAWAAAPSAARADTLAWLIDSNIDHPACELMWGSPGSLLAATFLHEHTGDARWADLIRRVAAQLRSELQWSDAHGCHYWLQHLYGQRCSYVDAVHGFVATAHGLMRARTALAADQWAFWQRCIVDTVTRSATHECGLANWRPELILPAGRQPRFLMQFCHGAPGFVICLSQFPGDALDPLLLAAGEAIWVAGPLAKGSNLCHGTAGNAYAFLVLHQRTRDPLWLQRARAFAMHATAQAEADARQYGQLRHSLWTGDLGLAIFLWDCIHAQAGFPTLEVFFDAGSRPRAGRSREKVLT
jgi:hypothetical protein